jgi:hypothetical protein
MRRSVDNICVHSQGWDYYGLATSQNQADVNSNDDSPCLFVEDALFRALKKCKLIPGKVSVLRIFY